MSRPIRFVSLLLAAVPLLASPAAAQEFDRTIAPLLARRCLDCHDGPRPKGGLSLSTRRAALAGGKHGNAIVPGRPDESLVWEHVRDGTMPPKRPLPDAEKARLRAWIAAGAPWGTDPIDPFRFTTEARAGYDWWSLRPVAPPDLPRVRAEDWMRNPIDRFVLAGLEAAGLRPSPEADGRTLIRRVTFDLTGVPPTAAEVEAFVREYGANPQATYARMVDRLLASPQYGERWARHWLDIVRFGESNGFEHDELRRNAWPYRDWVVQALNRDLPYDEFARLQLAGDVLRPTDPAAVAATGFLVAGGYDSVGQVQQSAAMKAVVRQDELEDVVGTVGQTFLGLTVHCARCHDHKFDPVRQREYYRLTAALAGVRHGERDVTPPEVVAESQRRLAHSQEKLKQLSEDLTTLKGPTRQVRFAELKALIAAEQARQATPAKSLAYAVVPRAPEMAHVLLRGEPSQKGDVVTPGGVAALTGLPAEFGLPADAADGPRRAKLAEWVTDAKNPLFARVIVNRLWQYHFGAGLVETPNDFGFNGGRPSHSELLDWLAAELVRQRWSLKAIHRLIVTSATYRQASRFDAAAARLDAGNRLLWRKSPTRLEAEAVRDAVLHVAGRLNRDMSGPGYQDFTVTVRGATYYYTPRDDEDPALNRRSLYRTWARSGRSRLLDALDCPDPSAVAPRRSVTTTPLQALTLLNGAFVLRLADHFADRLRREAGADVGRQVALAYALAYGRPPQPEEAAAARHAVEAHGLAVLCRAIFNSNEFLYVD